MHAFLSPADFFQNQLFEEKNQEYLQCQTVWILIRPDIYVEPDLGPNCLQRLSADDTSRLS